MERSLSGGGTGEGAGSCVAAAFGANPGGAPGALPECVARLTHVSLVYRAKTALDDITLALPAGRLTGFIGPDGVGKSSLLSLIAGARKVQGGHVEVLGGDMADAPHRTRVCPRIAYMPQGLGRNLYSSLSVYENIDFFARLFGLTLRERRQRIEELLQATGIAEFPDRPAGKLSGGMRQKLGLCCALVHDPDLLILDEPTTGVDPLSRRQFWELIATIRARRPGMSVLVATAYFDEAERFEWLVAMNAGRLLAVDAPEGVKRRAGAATLEDAFTALVLAPGQARPPKLMVPPRPQTKVEVAIEARDLTRRFGKFTAVDGVSFQIERGEIFGFLGPNGCGKTTTIKMLTGLLPATAGQALIFGNAFSPRDIDLRRRVGFMSQSFSLYGELSVRHNLELHARLFRLSRERIHSRIAELVEQFGLSAWLEEIPEHLPLGVRQRLSLAVAVIHEPDLLILDEPTSGVDPIARDRFWKLLIELSRTRGVTIFVSTHFMNEAERCDRVSLMSAGRVLAEGPPAQLACRVGARNLEEAFIKYLSAEAGPRAPERGRGAAFDGTQAAGAGDATLLSVGAGLPVDPGLGGSRGRRGAVGPGNGAGSHRSGPAGLSLGRLWAYARRESLEILLDPIRLGFAVLGPILLMIVFGFGITFDVERLAYAALDNDHSPESRAYLDTFSSSRYFTEHAPVRSPVDLETRMQRGELRLAVEIPPGFGRDLRSGRSPEVAVWVDGAFPFRAETTLGYVEGAHQAFLQELHRQAKQPGRTAAQVGVEARFRYNQDFRSVFAVVPGTLMLLLVFMPAIVTALGVVREKELGSIINFYVTPTTKLEFLLGKQLPYIGIACLNFASLLALALFTFHLSVKGSWIGLLLGVLLYVTATTGLGVLISNFVRTQIAAIIAAGFSTTVPAIQYSGYLLPVSSLSRDAQLFGRAFPSTYFLHISEGSFAKGLQLADMAVDLAALGVIVVVVTLIAHALLPAQES